MKLKILTLLSVAVLLTACGKGGVNDFKAPETSSAADMFANGCAGCHGSDGSGKFGMMFKLSPEGKSAEQLAATILSGREGMPSFPNLTEKQRLQLAEHILSIRQ